MKNEYYTAGEFAKLSGVSTRTIRFYDEKGLLKPVDYSESGYRYYDKDSFARLQKILMFKYLGFSLEQIVALMKNDLHNREAMKHSLAKQRHLLITKQKEIAHFLEAIDIAETCNEEDDWNTLLGILNLFSDQEEMEKQYEDDGNLNRRISIHSYSTNPVKKKYSEML